jgi:hypothetical protein
VRHEDDYAAYLCSCFTPFERGRRYDVGLSCSPGQSRSPLPSSCSHLFSLGTGPDVYKREAMDPSSEFSFLFPFHPFAHAPTDTFIHRISSLLWQTDFTSAQPYYILLLTLDSCLIILSYLLLSPTYSPHHPSLIVSVI